MFVPIFGYLCSVNPIKSLKVKQFHKKSMAQKLYMVPFEAVASSSISSQVPAVRMMLSLCKFGTGNLIEENTVQ